MAQREDYGIDAPGVQRNLAVFGGIGIAAALAIPHLPLPPIVAAFRPTLFFAGIAMAAMAVWMFVSSRFLKQRTRDALLAMRQWRGEEAVLDLGCGRGLALIGAARRVPRGHATGIDLWAERDLAGNSPDRARANAAAAGVADRVTIDTGDMRALPYPDASFDVIVSMTAIHNIEDADDRARAMAEAWRVTKPGGQLLLYDIRHARHYAAQLSALGATDVRVAGPILLWGVLGWRVAATKPGSGLNLQRARSSRPSEGDSYDDLCRLPHIAPRHNPARSSAR